MDVLFDSIVDEITHSGVARKQRSITRLFPEFPGRVRAVAAKGGLRLLDLQPDLWHFKIHSGTDDSLWYDAYIKFKDLPGLIGSLVGDLRLWTKDRSHVDLRKLAKKVMFKAEIQLKCNCPAFQYWGPAFILSLSKYDGKYTDPERRPPRIRNPKKYGAVCKHLQNLLNVYPWYQSTMAKWLKDYHIKQIRRLERDAKREKEELKRAAVELGRRKEEEEPEEEEREERE